MPEGYLKPKKGRARIYIFNRLVIYGFKFRTYVSGEFSGTSISNSDL